MYEPHYTCVWNLIIGYKRVWNLKLIAAQHLAAWGCGFEVYKWEREEHKFPQQSHIAKPEGIKWSEVRQLCFHAESCSLFWDCVHFPAFNPWIWQSTLNWLSEATWPSLSLLWWVRMLKMMFFHLPFPFFFLFFYFFLPFLKKNNFIVV